MSDMKHTPGPWDAYHDKGWLVVASKDERLYVQIEKGSSAKKRIADAILIAAAPELLEALKRLMVLSYPYSGTPSMKDMLEYWEHEKTQGRGEAEDRLFALAAIAKAEGGAV